MDKKAVYAAYRYYRGKTADIDLSIYNDFVSKGYKMTNLIEMYGYNAHTIYRKAEEVKCFIATYEKYSHVRLPEKIRIECDRTKSALEVINMSFAAYQAAGDACIPLIDLKVRFPGLKNSTNRANLIETLRTSTAIYVPMTVLYDYGYLCPEPGSDEPAFAIYRWVDYLHGCLYYAFSQRMAWLLSHGSDKVQAWNPLDEYPRKT